MPLRFAKILPLFVSLALLVGCDGKEKPTPTTTIAPPPLAEGQTPPAIASVDGGSSGSTNNTTPATGNQNGGAPAIGTPTATVAAEGALAPYATALAIVQPDHFAVVKFDMARMRNSAFLKSMPFDAQQMASNLPVPGAPEGDAATEMAKNLEQVETLWVSLGPPRGVDGMPVSLAIHARCTSPQAANDALKAMQADPANADRMEHQGNAYFKSKSPGGPIWTVQGSDVIISSDENVVRNAMAAGGKIVESDVLKKLAAARLDAPLVIAGSFGPFKTPMSLMAVGALKELTDTPFPLSPELGKLPQQIDFAVIAIDPDAEAIIDIDADMDAEQSAENFKTSLEGVVSLAKIMLGQQAGAAAQAGEIDPETQQAFGIAKAGLDAVSVKHEARHVDASFNRFAQLADVPALMATQVERAKTMQFVNNAKMLGLAAHMQRDAMRRGPQNVKNAAGDTLLSWRFEVLPYVEATTLYEQLKRDEPWDSATNQQLSATMPAIFATPSTTEPNMTTWKMLPEENASGIMMLDTGKGTAIHWLRPDVFDVAGNPAAALGEEPAGGYIVVNRDGSVERLPHAELVAKLSSKPAGEAPAVGDPTAEPPAADGPLASEEPRFWQPAAGRTKIKAVLLGVKDGKVSLKRSDTNRTFVVPLEKLSQADQDYIRSLNLPN